MKDSKTGLRHGQGPPYLVVDPYFVRGNIRASMLSRHEVAVDAIATVFFGVYKWIFRIPNGWPKNKSSDSFLGHRAKPSDFSLGFSWRHFEVMKEVFVRKDIPTK